MKTIIDLKQYQSHECSYYKGIPIEYLEITKKILKAHGFKYRMRYRGPRKGDGRHKYSQQSHCLKSFATSFAVYRNV